MEEHFFTESEREAQPILLVYTWYDTHVNSLKPVHVS